MSLKVIYVVMGLGLFANGVYMFVASESWYHLKILGVEDTGPMNIHFIRDLGVVYAIVGFGLLWSSVNLARCQIVHIGVTMFLLGHALEHVLEILMGDLPHSHWYIDAGGVFVPAALFTVLALPPVWARVNPQAAKAGESPDSSSE